IGFCLAMRGASTAARVIMTTMTIPIRARLSRKNLFRCAGSSINCLRLDFSRRWIPQLRRRVRRLAFPSAVLPEVLRRRDTHPLFEKLGVASDDRIYITVLVPRRGNLDRLEHKSKASIRFSYGDHEQDGHLETQGEYRRASRGLCRTAEERHESRRETKHSLVRDEAYRSSVAQRARRTSHRLRVVNDLDPHFLASGIEPLVEERIGHPPADRVHRNPTRRDICSTELPVAHMSGDENQSFPTRHCVLEQIPALDGFYELQKTVAADRAKQRGLDRGSPKMAVGFPGKLYDFRR